MPQRPKIIVLNNDSAFLDLMKEALGDEGFDVVVRKVWDDAYHTVKQVKPDLIILDVLLDNEGKGFELIDLLTLDPQTRSTPVVVASTSTRQLHERMDAFTTMGIPVIGKPFDLDTLLSVIRRALQAGTRQGAHEMGLGGQVDETGVGGGAQSARDGESRAR